MSYLELKYTLLLSYCSFLSVFLLLKLEGHDNLKDHPVISRLLYVKTLLERLRPLDQKLQYQIDKLLRAAALADTQKQVSADALQYKPNIENLQDIEEESEDAEEESTEEKGKKKEVFKAAKLNPVMFEDKETKRQRRNELFSKKNAARSDYVSELRREIYDLPEEVHLGGMSNQQTRYAREQDKIERMEQEHMKRMQFSKREIKDMR